MAEHDDLEIGIAAGLDVPTALALEDDEPQRPRSGRAFAWVLLGSIAVLVLWWLSR